MTSLEWNVNHSFYIHPSENPNKLLSESLLIRGVRRTVGAKNKMYFILENTSIEKPKLGDKLYDA